MNFLNKEQEDGNQSQGYQKPMGHRNNGEKKRFWQVKVLWDNEEEILEPVHVMRKDHHPEMAQ